MFKKPNTVPTPDDFYDVALKKCTPAEFKLLACVINKTFRWGKLWDYISTSQFMSATGLSNKGVILGLRSLEEQGWIQSVYVCSNCGKPFNRSQFVSDDKQGKVHVSSTAVCFNCHTNVSPQKFYAAKVEGEDLITHLESIFHRKMGGSEQCSQGAVNNVHRVGKGKTRRKANGDKPSSVSTEKFEAVNNVHTQETIPETSGNGFSEKPEKPFPADDFAHAWGGATSSGNSSHQQSIQVQPDNSSEVGPGLKEPGEVKLPEFKSVEEAAKYYGLV